LAAQSFGLGWGRAWLSRQGAALAKGNEMIPALFGTPPAGVRVLIATHPVDFRCGADNVAVMVECNPPARLTDPAGSRHRPSRPPQGGGQAPLTPFPLSAAEIGVSPGRASRSGPERAAGGTPSCISSGSIRITRPRRATLAGETLRGPQ